MLTLAISHHYSLLVRVNQKDDGVMKEFIEDG